SCLQFLCFVLSTSDLVCLAFFFSFTLPLPTLIYTLSLHDALPISGAGLRRVADVPRCRAGGHVFHSHCLDGIHPGGRRGGACGAGGVALAQRAARVCAHSSALGAAVASVRSLVPAPGELDLRLPAQD